MNHLNICLNKCVRKLVRDEPEKMFNENLIENIDMILVSDHLMHLQYDKADSIIKSILNSWRPKYILMRS